MEGGLLKVDGAIIDYDYGFGQGDNMFGCLGEAFLVALDDGRSLKPTLGPVELGNFSQLLEFCKEQGVREGDFKSSNTDISDKEICDALRKRTRTSKPASAI